MARKLVKLADQAAAALVVQALMRAVLHRQQDKVTLAVKAFKKIQVVVVALGQSAWRAHLAAAVPVALV